MRRFIVAAAALGAAALTSGGLLLATARGQGPDEVYVLARDLPAGAPLTQDALATARLQLGPASAGALHAGSRPSALSAVAAHDLRASQLLQRSDLAPAGAPAGDRRAVFVPLKEVPAVAAGSRIDILSVTGPPDRPLVSPLALDLEVRSASQSGIVVSLPARQAPALVYAVAAVRLVAVTADAGARRADEPAVTSLDQAVEMLRR